MPKKSNAVGPTGERVAANVRSIRDERGTSKAALSRTLTELERTMSLDVITKVESGSRPVDADDLVALAVAFRVSPVRLLLPVADAGDEVALTPTVTATQAQAWAWALGQSPLLAALSDDELDHGSPDTIFDDFRRHSLPADERLRDDHSAVRAAQSVLDSVRAVLRRSEHPDEFELEDKLRERSPRAVTKLGPDTSTPEGLRARLRVLREEINALLGDEG